MVDGLCVGRDNGNEFVLQQNMKYANKEMNTQPPCKTKHPLQTPNHTQDDTHTLYEGFVLLLNDTHTHTRLTSV